MTSADAAASAIVGTRQGFSLAELWLDRRDLAARDHHYEAAPATAASRAVAGSSVSQVSQSASQ